MLPVKPNNQTRNTRANSRKNTKSKGEATHQSINPISNKSKSKNKEFNCANQANNTTEECDPTINTGLINRKHNQPGDTKPTIRKVSFQNKPIIKQLNKKLNTFTKQYAPEYFTTILEYMIDKEVRNTASPTVEKLNKWRIYIERQRRIQLQVRKQVRRMANMIITGRKKFKQSIKQQQRRNKFFNSQNQQECDSYQFIPNMKSQRFVQQYDSDLSSSEICSSIQNASCPDIINYQQNLQKETPQLLTQNKLLKEWETRFDQFACIVQTIYQLLGQNQCNNTIFPTCYILYTLLVVDNKVFNYINKYNKKNQDFQSSQDCFQNRYMPISNYKQPTSIQMLQYYLIISILIATKYHEIYPASLVDLIQSVNSSLSFDRATKIEGQVLQMFNFSQFFNENQLKFLKMFGIIVGWSTNQMNVCEFMLQSGLNNPKLYSYSPLYKAAVIIGLYQQQFLKSQQKFMMIKNLCPGLSLQLGTRIKKQYSQIIIYNYKNKLNAQKRKFFIFDNQMKNLLGRANLN